MMGFTKSELIELMKAQNIPEETQQILLPIMKENYDGYRFSIYSEEKLYNSNMCLFYLSDFIRLKRFPEYG